MPPTRPVEVLCRSKVERCLTRTPKFSTDFAAVLGFLFDRPSWTEPRIRGLCLSANRCLWARVDTEYDRYIGSEENVCRLLDDLAQEAGLDSSEHALLFHLFRTRTLDLATK